MVTSTPSLVASALLLLTLQTALGQLPCMVERFTGPPFNNQTVEFSMVGRKNQTGHWTTQVLLNSASPRMHNNWKMDVKQYTAEYGGVYTFQITGVLTVPPPRQHDYELFPGIGYYKFHSANKATFLEASTVCGKEGAHLAIIDSDEEASALKTLYLRNLSEGGPFAYVGFYDRTKKREWVTVFGQPLIQMKWHPNKPDNNQQFCGTVHQDGLLGAAVCEDKLAFFCEYDLSWGNV